MEVHFNYIINRHNNLKFKYMKNYIPKHKFYFHHNLIRKHSYHFITHYILFLMVNKYHK